MHRVEEEKKERNVEWGGYGMRVEMEVVEEKGCMEEEGCVEGMREIFEIERWVEGVGEEREYNE